MSGETTSLVHDLTVWRISNYTDLSGLGGELFSGRWHTRGRPIVYFADSPAGALIESIVHFELGKDEMPETFRLMEIRVESGVLVSAVDSVASGWEDRQVLTRSLGDAWLAEAETALLKVPSALVPRAGNYLLNPMHADAGLVTVEEIVEGRYDVRFFGDR